MPKIKSSIIRKCTTLTIHNTTTISSPKQKLHRKSPITKSTHTFDYVSCRNVPNALRTRVSIHWYELNNDTWS